MTTSTLKSNSARAKSASWLQSIWQQVVEGLTTKTELQVWQERDRDGKLLWYAYDPTSGRSFFGTEAEMRSWIETRNYCY
ncbi:MAG: hypothetical protein HC895_15900 [Leptolyngbyaceae cyanobacterium SM1_3_5]|nr:hypothetical protein [Leptolyngbyaceae cyanobacterium SM1_3_5]